jgi:hypothetical protein
MASGHEIGNQVDSALVRVEMDAMRSLYAFAETHGYGRAMQLLSDAWRDKDPVGALSVGSCYGVLAHEEQERVRLAEAATAEVERLRNVIRKHRDTRGDDKCFLDDAELYMDGLPEGDTRPLRDSAVTIENCLRFINSRMDPQREYVSPEREIERLRSEQARLATLLLHVWRTACALDVVSADGPMYDHRGIAAYQEAQRWLIAQGLIQAGQCVRE